jgi:hypothetical protein
LRRRRRTAVTNRAHRQVKRDWGERPRMREGAWRRRCSREAAAAAAGVEVEVEVEEGWWCPWIAW